MRTFILPSVTVEFYPWGALTCFSDGVELKAAPQDDRDYLNRARDLGYGNDALTMCQDHELLHSVVAEMLHAGPSPALWRAAHGDRSKRGLGAEEDLVLRMQQVLRRGAQQ